MTSSAARFYEGDVLYGRMRPYLNKVASPSFDGLASAEFIVFPKSDVVESRFLLSRLSSTDFTEFACAQYEGDRPRVKFDQLGAFWLNLPPVAEQIRIVDKLEELLSDLDAGVAELKAAQRKLALLRQSLLKAVVEGALTADWRAAQAQPTESGAALLQRILTERRARWERKQRDKYAAQGKTPPKGWQSRYPEPVAPDTTGLPELPEGWVWASLDMLVAESSYGTSVKCSYESKGTPVLRIPNISGGQLKLEGIKFASQRLSLGPRDHLTVGDVLVIRTNGSIGLVGRAAALQAPLASNHYFASYLLRLRCVETEISHRWISMVLASPFGRRWIEVRAASSAGQHNISLSTLLTMPVPLPPALEQYQGLQSLDVALGDIERLAAESSVSLRQSTAQRKNLLRAAFAGQLVPQDPNDEPASALLARIRAARAGQDGKGAKPRGRRPETA